MPGKKMRFTKIILSILFPIATFAQKNTSTFEAYMQGQDMELIPESETKFFNAEGSDQQLIFTKDSGGNIAKVFYIGYGVKKEIVKID